jgi:hypothetical protein
MTGWQLLDNNPATASIITDDTGLLYQMHGDGTIWVYRGPPMTGWQLLDNNPGTRAITAAGATKIWARLNFSMQHQMQTNWCWAASSSSVNAFFNSSTSWTQCKIVNAELGKSECCKNGSGNDCNIPWYLDKALARVGNFQSWSSGAGSIDDIVKEIDNGRMLCARIGWNGGGGHFVAVEGYNSDLNMVAIEDPWYGPSDITLDTFKSAYKGSGSWTHKYYVKP